MALTSSCHSAFVARHVSVHVGWGINRWNKGTFDFIVFPVSTSEIRTRLRLRRNIDWRCNDAELSEIISETNSDVFTQNFDFFL